MNHRLPVGLAVAATIIIGLPFIFLISSNYSDGRLSALAELISAAASSIAFVWLILGQYTVFRGLEKQTQSIALQEQDISLQRRAISETSEAVAAELYLLLLRDAQATLSRYCRSIIACVPSIDIDALDRQVGEHQDPSLYATKLANDKTIRSFITTHRADVPIAQLIDSFNSTYREIEALSTSSKQKVDVFSVTMSNSVYQQIYHSLFSNKVKGAVS
jgi:hypothetical protein